MADTDRIHVEVTGSSRDLQRAALGAVAAIKGVSAETKRADRDTARSAATNERMAGSLRSIERDSKVATRGLRTLHVAIGLLAAEAAPLAGGLAGVGVAGAGLGVAMLGAGQGIGVAALALKDIKPALDGNKKALKELDPAARQFVKTLKSDFGPEIERMQGLAQAGLFPGLVKGLDSALPTLRSLEGVVGATAREMGHLAEEAGQALGSQGWQRDLQTIGTRNVRLLDDMGHGVGNLADTARHLVVAGGPYVDWLSDSALGLTEHADAAARAARADGSLARFLDSTKPGLSELAGLVGDLTGELAFLATHNQAAFADLARTLRSEAVPVIHQLLVELTDLAPHLNTALKGVLELAKELAPGLRPVVALLGRLLDEVGQVSHGLANLNKGLPPIAKTLEIGLAIAGFVKLRALIRATKAEAAATAAVGAGAGAAGAGAAGAAGGAAAGAAAAGGLRGMVGRLKPLAKKLGAVGIGLSLLDGVGQALGGDNLTLRGKITQGLGKALAGAGPDVKKQAHKAISTMLGEVSRGGNFNLPKQKRSLFGVDELAPDATGFKDVSDKIKREIRSLTAAFTAARQTGAFDSLRAQIRKFGAAHPDFKADVDRMLRDLRRLRSQFGAPIKVAVGFGRALREDGVDVKRATKAMLDHLDDLPPGARRSAVRMTRGMVAELRRNRTLSGSQAAAIEKAIAGHVEEADRRSRRATGRLAKGAARDLANLTDAVNSGIVSTLGGMNAALDAMGLKPISFTAKKSKGKGAASGFGEFPAQVPIKDAPKTPRRARGGMVQYGRAGESGRDSIPTNIGGQDVVVAPGEVAAVFNRHQLPVVNARLSDLGGLPGLFRKVDKPHHMAGGGIVGLGRQLQQQGYQVGEHPAFGGVAPVHTGGSYHYRGMALDVNADGKPGGEAKWLDRLYGQLKGMPGVVELLWRVANHFDHLHVAMAGGGGKLGKLGALDSAPEIAKVLLSGPDGPLKDLGQKALDKVHAGAVKKLAKEGSGPGGGGSFAGFSGEWTEVMAKIAEERGWSLSDWKELVRRESGGNPNARNPSSGAYGIGQFLGSTLQAYAKHGATSSDPVDQIQAMGKYIADRYGTPTGALNFHNAHNWYAQGGMIGGDGGSILDYLPAAKGLQVKGGKPRDLRKGRKGKRLYGPKGKALRPNRNARLIGKGAPPASPQSIFAALGRFVEDQDSLFSDDERRFQLDEVITPDELNKLLGRAGGIRGAISRQLELLKGSIVPQTTRELDQVRKQVKAHVARVKRLVARLKRIRTDLRRIGKKKKPTRADKARQQALRADAANVHQELAHLTGNRNPNPNQLGDAGGVIGKARARQEKLETDLPPMVEELRPSKLPAQLRDWDFTIAELRKNGATKPEKPDNSEQLGLMRESLAATSRSLSVSQAQFDVLRGFAGQIPRYAHGTQRVPQTGLALVHRDEQIITDPKGPYGSQTARGGGPGPVNVTVLFKGEAPSYSDVEVLVDGKLQAYNRETVRRTRQITSAPGR